ncbi:hypothetical protein C2W62_42095 [Candidatus Entotheonella serta]|nr:hypothetical protein C2W62_42095 [Candidatus Entotheonella serta]
MAREGFLTFEGPVTFAEKLRFSGGVMKHATAPVAKLLAAVGIENADDAIWGEQKQRLDALRAAVESSATTWQTPEKKAKTIVVTSPRNRFGACIPRPTCTPPICLEQVGRSIATRWG